MARAGSDLPLATQDQPDCRLRQGGLTLIELMISLAVLAVLLTLGVSSSFWVERSRSNEAASQLSTAYSKTRSIAVRNPLSTAPNEPAAVMCVANATLYVHQGLPAACGIDATWQSSLAGGARTRIRIDSETAPNFACVAVDNRSRKVDAAIGTINCTIDRDLTVSNGGWDAKARIL